MVDLPNKDVGCHHTGFARKCRDLVSSGECTRWMLIQGTSPNNGQPVNRHDCVDNWTPLLLIEAALQARQSGASADKVANEVRRFHNSMREMNGAPPLGVESYVPQAIDAPRA
ncbi:hypothetical protein [Rhodoplanes serenus]|uniref:hypothetical protein n=1 Tax=Rhodoplanes serenus TaxID=200615 RepID=UPI000DAC0114|nr:hypothetical protein [Rhodoplanes serenus]RAI34513.1 hypothetical protein CH340_08785 [Rhodoplanes serenus]